MNTSTNKIALLNNPKFGGLDNYEFRGKTDSLDNWAKRILGLRVEKHNQIIALAWDAEKGQFDYAHVLGLADLNVLMEGETIGYNVISECNTKFRGFPKMQEDAKALYRTIITVVKNAGKFYKELNAKKIEECDFVPTF